MGFSSMIRIWLALRSGLGVSLLLLGATPNLFACAKPARGESVTAPRPTQAANERRYSVGGYVSGLVGTGLLLQSDDGAELLVHGNGAFAFPALRESGSAYLVSVRANPDSERQLCTVAPDLETGNIEHADVTTILVRCIRGRYHRARNHRSVLSRVVHARAPGASAR
jgi:hypothetical protein